METAETMLMLRAECLTCPMDESHSLLPWSALPMLCPSAQHHAGPMHRAVTVGWMVQRSSNPLPFLRSPGNLLFWKHLGRQVHLEITVTQEPSSHSHLLEKAFSPLIFTLQGASSPHLSLSIFLLCHSLSPLSHGYTFSCLFSISISGKSDW